jgi:cell division GTPase FtsZ
MNIGIIGCGQMGNVFADEISSKYDEIVALGINTSATDLASCQNLKHTLKLNGFGAGKNRELAQETVREQMDIVYNKVNEVFAHVELIAVVFSSSGGTGSGISPFLLEVLPELMPDKVFISMVVMPDLSESMVNQVNCLKVFEELSRLNVAVFPIDNQQVKGMYLNIGKNKLFEITNQKAIDLLMKLISYTDKYSKHGNLDKQDLLTILNTQGIAIISEVDLITIQANVTPEGVAQKIQESWNRSVFTPIEFDKVTKAGVVFDGQESLMEYIKYEQIFSKFNCGLPLDLFEGSYHANSGKVITVLTGLGWCNKRLNDIERLLESNKDNMESVFASSSVYQSKVSLDLMATIRKPQQHQQTKTQQSAKDILSKFMKK